MPHVVLLGDSIFDNARYVPDGRSVVTQVNRLLPAGWQGTLLARDGAGVEELDHQIEQVPIGATHLVVSIGGNNALDLSPILRNEPATSYAEVLAHLGQVREEFRQNYRQRLRALCQSGKAVAVCTIYDAIPDLHPAEATGLCLFNDAILIEAFAARVPVLDLRRVCTERGDYSERSPIEPSTSGGGKIAAALVRLVTQCDFGADSSRVYP